MIMTFHPASLTGHVCWHNYVSVSEAVFFFLLVAITVTVRFVSDVRDARLHLRPFFHMQINFSII